MINFNNPYNRADFLQFLENHFLPDDFQIQEEKFEQLNFPTKYTVEAMRLGTCKSLELDVFEITHTSAHDARVGIAQDAFRLMLHKSYNNRALIVFRQEGSKQYRFSLLQIEAEKTENSSRITRSYSNPRRYSFLLGEGAHVKTPEQFLLGKGKLKKTEGDYFKDLQERFSVEVLTKLFYKELSNWYFWAIKFAEFPNNIDDEKDNFKYNPENIIRLITRLIFVWFLKQKELVQSDLFEEKRLKEILKNFNPESKIQNHYYRAILQNLFFATLNQEIEKRGFAENKTHNENRSTYNIKNLYRYENEFKNKDTTEIMRLFSQVPFLNGGLFECLDGKKKLNEDTKKEETFYWDGFSRITKRQANIPNYLFFAEEQTIDLSSEYNDNRMKNVKVSGIIEILKRYNFTIEENTPVEIQVALDPELLGKVFENLLGAFNPETQETARKQTGSFYTPREIVSYMVNESLMSYFQASVPSISEKMLKTLFEYEEKEIDITSSQRKALIEAIFECKILDPACGSGAYPMGILQQMVHILGQLDPENEFWQNTIIEQTTKELDQVENANFDEKDVLIEQIYKTFDNNVNYPDYTRKLYLIENCIYGIDIQSVAVQISKLRFFISLICEQKRTDDVSNNFGIRPLPNLETKFVAANTLLSIEKAGEDMQYLKDDHIKKLVDKLQEIRHRQFSITKVSDKIRLREKDENVRFDIVNEVERLYIKHADENIEAYKKERSIAEKQLELLNRTPDDFRITTETDLFGNKKETHYNFTETKRKELTLRIKKLSLEIEKGSVYSRLNSVVKLARQLTKWNPYDQNETSPFFDAEWMFGVKDGFDIVIGNPPYFSLSTNSNIKDNNGKSLKHNKLYEKCLYKTFENSGDIYCLFYERGWQLLKESGHLCYITSNKWMRAGYGEATRKFFAENTNPKQLIDFAGIKVFESATVDTNILLFAKENNTLKTQACVVKDKELKNLSDYFRQNVTISAFSGGESWVILSEIEQRIKAKIEAVGTPLKDWDIQINYGIKTGFNEAFIIDDKKRQELIEQDPKSDEIIRPILRGRDIKRYSYEFADLYLIATFPSLKIEIDEYPAVKQHLLSFGYDRLKQTGDKGSRKKTNNKWFETQDSISYWEDFSKQKIVWARLMRISKNDFSSFPRFCLIEKDKYVLDSLCFFSGNKLEILLKLLNSEYAAYYFFNNIAILDNGGMQMRQQYVENILLPKFTKIQNDINTQIYNAFNFNEQEISEIKNFLRNKKNEISEQKDD